MSQSSSPISARDQVFAAIYSRSERYRSFEIDDIERDLYLSDRVEDPPSRETIRRTLKGLSEIGMIEHRSGSPVYQVRDDFDISKI